MSSIKDKLMKLLTDHLKGGGYMSTSRGNAEYVLLNEENGSYETFDSREELDEFLEEEDFSQNEANQLRIFSVDQEYKAVTKSFELEEV